MKILLISILTMLLYSCSNTDSTAQIESLKVLQSCTMAEFSHGTEKLWNVRFLEKDKTQFNTSGRLSISQILNNSMNAVDSLSIPLMHKLNLLRVKIVNSKLTKDLNSNYPIEIGYSNESEFNKSALPTENEIAKIITSIGGYRNGLCRILIEKNYFDMFEKVRVFAVPEIPPFKNEKQKVKFIDQQLKLSEVYEDDIHGLKESMDILTKKEDTWKSMFTNDANWIDQSMSLLSIQEFILRARTIAFSNLQNRISFCGESIFSKAIPIIVGSSNALPNDTVQFQVFLGGYNEYSTSEIEIAKGGEFLKTENGKSFIEAVVPTSGEIEINGDILYQLKNGRIKPIPWSHRITVINEN